MKISKTVLGDKTLVAVSGAVDNTNANILRDALLDLDYNGLDLTLDFSDMDYITSAGLRALLVARKRLTADTMRIINANTAVVEVFDMTGFDNMINISAKQLSDNNGQYRLSFPSLLRKRLESDRFNTAYIYLDKEYTWDDIDKASQIIADDLSGLGVKKGTHVGICGANSINWVFTFFAIQKLGGIAILVNPGLRSHEVLTVSGIGDVTIMCYAEIPKVTTFETYSEVILSGGSPVKHMYNISDSVDFMARMDEYPAIADKYCESFLADDASVVIFSSGTTSLPKAILASAYNLLVSIDPLIEEYKVCKDDVNLAFLPMFHIFGFATNISLALMTGYVSVIPAKKKPDVIIGLIDKYKCTVFNSVPTMMLAMTQAESFSPEKLSSLRMSILGGSATTEVQMNMLRKLLPNNHFGNIYGMSENAAVSLTLYEDSVEHITQTVGKPVPGLEIELRDLADGKPVKQGERGEIFIRSAAMVVCYYNLAIEKQPVDDEGWLATGDIGVLDEDGYLHLVGRTKDLIIVGGENISPGEIAEVIAQIPEIADVKVMGIPHEIKGEQVVAAVILKSGAEWDEAAVKSYMASHISRYKIPSHFVVYDKFPLLGSGKVDVRTLKESLVEKTLGK